MTKGQKQFLIDWINVMLEHPGKTIKLSKDGIVALETDAPPELIIEGKIINEG